MDYTAIVMSMLEEMRGNDVPERFVRKIEFNIGHDLFEVMPEDFEEFRACRPDNITNVHYHIDVRKIVASVQAERDILMKLAKIY